MPGLSLLFDCPPAHRHLYLFFFNDTATTEIYTLSLHDALPISCRRLNASSCRVSSAARSPAWRISSASSRRGRSEEHTSELQSQSNLVCRLLLEKKKKVTAASDESPVLRVRM